MKLTKKFHRDIIDTDTKTFIKLGVQSFYTTNSAIKLNKCHVL
jgi:hypothetical protein